MTPDTRTFHIQTFGCQMNAADSEWLSRSLEGLGFREAPFEEAAFHILNTCSVRDKPEQKVYSELGRIARHCKVNKIDGVTVCVGGCVAQQAGPALAKRFPQVRLVFGTDGIARAPEAISRLAEEKRLRLSLLDFAEDYVERADPRLESGRRVPAPPSVFVNIMQGCDNYCAYCIVPYVRGGQKSRRAQAVVDECRTLVEAGSREITLLGQNVNAYGQDKGADGASFASLLHNVAAIPGLERLRFVTSHPKDIAPEVVAAFAGLPALCPRLHLPLQSGSDKILRAMNRRYDTARYRAIVKALRAARPDIVLTTDVIVGFPGESEDDFTATMDIMEEVGFASAFSFVYSDRPRARATLLPDKVDRALAFERLSRLQEKQNQASERVLAAMVGSDSVILVESRSRMAAPPAPEASEPDARAPQPTGDGCFWQGKTPQGFIVNVRLDGAPDAGRPARDGLCDAWLGAMVPVRIEEAAKHSLKGRQAGAPW
ncbi:MAG: tRNA (N6-isopentenyl adenosine(37)-C2)-methylthiotransferase MiaB [Desulfovibrio sp.]|jgi:tRNA-2-methylthio-N6-dimethylallyladenosine synthase|nr:tRNA (N6-isopentenyl adenosine(37)-C2)-methylthiotransferase MiaB [Desulfovibrio sp.]